jgi:hypothetical protein
MEVSVGPLFPDFVLMKVRWGADDTRPWVAVRVGIVGWVQQDPEDAEHERRHRDEPCHCPSPAPIRSPVLAGRAPQPAGNDQGNDDQEGDAEIPKLRCLILDADERGDEAEDGDDRGADRADRHLTGDPPSPATILIGHYNAPPYRIVILWDYL